LDGDEVTVSAIRQVFAVSLYRRSPAGASTPAA
jgi:hypothetical protein